MLRTRVRRLEEQMERALTLETAIMWLRKHDYHQIEKVEDGLVSVLDAIRDIVNGNGSPLAKADKGATQLCTKCGRTLPVDAFSIDRARTNGRQSWCRECSAAYKMRYRGKSRVCTKCGRELPIEEFHRDSAQKGGRHTQCRHCRSKQRKQVRRAKARRKA
jgi:DNA-directed RNA polymerase subunit RPC12/RpoP